MGFRHMEVTAYVHKDSLGEVGLDENELKWIQRIGGEELNTMNALHF